MSESQESTIAGVGTAYLSAEEDSLDDDSDTFPIHGLALGVDDVTIGQSGTKKRWPADELKEAASSLEGTLVRDHINTTEGKVGEVTEAAFVEDVGVVYEAEVAEHYDELIDDLEAGLMEVSVRAYHSPEEELEEDDTGALVVDNVYFDNLSVVVDGASPSNTAEPGAADSIADYGESVEASASFSEGRVTATLERSDAAREHEESLGHYSDSSHAMYDETWGKRYEADFGSVSVAHQTSDGDSVTVGSAWAQAPYCVSIHAHGSKHFFDSMSMSESIGQAGPFEAHEEAEDIEVELDESFDESREFFATICYVDDDGERGSIITMDYGTPVVDTAVAVVSGDDSELAEGARGALAEEDLEAFTETVEASELAQIADEDEESEEEATEEASAEEETEEASESDPVEDVDEESDELEDDPESDPETEQEELEDETDDLDDEEAELESEGEDTESDTEEASQDEPVAGSRKEPVATTATLTGHSPDESQLNSTDTMIEYESADPEELGDDLDEPVVVEKDELEDMADKADKADDVEAELGNLSEKLDEQDEASEVVDELSDADIDLVTSETEVSVVEASEAEMFGEVQDIYAEELEDYYPGMEAEDLAEKFTPTELRGLVDDHEEAELSSSISESEPEPEAGSPDEAELSEEEADDEEAREQYAAELEKQGWDTQAEKIRSGELPLKAE